MAPVSLDMTPARIFECNSTRDIDIQLTCRKPASSFLVYVFLFYYLFIYVILSTIITVGIIEPNLLGGVQCQCVRQIVSGDAPRFSRPK